MLGKQLMDSRALGAVRQFVDWRIPFTNGDDLPLRNRGQDFAEPPHPALVTGFQGRLPLAPQLFERSRIQSSGPSPLPARVDDFEQVSAMLATEAIGKRYPAAANAAQL